MLVLPPGELERGFGVAGWHDTVAAFRRFILFHTRDRSRIVTAPEETDCAAIIPVLLALVPRPDNDYDSRAIAVTAPPSHGGSVLDRHLGYLYEKWLYRMSPLIQELTAHSPVPVACQGYIELYSLSSVGRDEDWDEDEDEPWTPSNSAPLSPAEEKKLGYAIGQVRLRWAWSDVLKPLVARYVEELGESTADVGTPVKAEDRRLANELRCAHLTRLSDLLRGAQAARAATGAWGQETARSRAQDARDAAAEEQNAEWAAWRREPHGRRGITAVGRTHHVGLVDDCSAAIGWWRLPDGPLTLTDERARADALAALAAFGISVDQQPRLDELPDFPDATIRIDGAIWMIHSVEPDGLPGSIPEIARYDRDRDVLTVYARPHREPITVLLRRHGITPGTVTWGDPSRDVQDHNERAREPRARATPFLDGRFPLREDLRRHLPEHFLAQLPITWRSAGHRGGTDPYLVDLNRQALRDLLGTGDEQPPQPTRCRLCGDDAFGTPDGLAYCTGCTSRARHGVLRDTGVDKPWADIAVWALRRLADIEFSGPPSQAQLERLTVTDPDTADTAMLCRFLIPRPRTAAVPVRHRRPARSWPEWLHRAGLLEDGLRTARGTVSIATDGHLCRSMLERHIDDFLHHWGIAHDVEPGYPGHPDLNTTGLRADWRLADGTFVEALGLPDEPAYAAKVARKRQLADILGTPLITLTAEDLNRLPEVFATWLSPASHPAPSPPS